MVFNSQSIMNAGARESAGSEDVLDCCLILQAKSRLRMREKNVGVY